MTRLVQRVMHCPCGNPKVLALGLCATCYTLDVVVAMNAPFRSAYTVLPEKAG